jgi:disulfide bond formation protein DsbB
MTNYLPGMRLCFLLVFIFSVGAMASMLYMQHVMGLPPCALCITQRIFMMGLGFTALIAAIHNPKLWGRRVYAVVGLAFSGGGVFFANHHRWLQNLPEDQVPACGPGLDYLWENFPVLDALKLLLRGDGNCAEVQWTFLTLSIPEWALVAFIGLGGVFIWQLLRPSH